MIPTVDNAPPVQPEGLTAAERTLWAETVGRLPSGYFPPEATEQLAAYCRHAVAARDLSRLIAEFSREWLKAEGGLERLDKLLRARDRETRAMLACARALRLTNQSRQDARGAARRAVGPWASPYDMMQGDDDDV